MFPAIYSVDNFCKVFKEGVLDINTLRKLSPAKEVSFLKVPVNFESIPYKDQRLYIKYLDLKAQTDEGIFKNYFKKQSAEHKRYRRAIQSLIERGWGTRCAKTEAGSISLRSYQHVWRDLGVDRLVKKKKRFHDTRKGTGYGFYYFKIQIDWLESERKVYYQQIKDIIQKKMSKRRRAQIRWSLKQKKVNDLTQANFSAKSAAVLFGYRSPSTGSKLRKKHFSVIAADSKPFFNRVTGRYEEPTKKIAL